MLCNQTASYILEQRFNFGIKKIKKLIIKKIKIKYKLFKFKTYN